MESRNIIIIGVWAFVIIAIIGFFMSGIAMEFFGYLILFFIALISTILVLAIPGEKKPEIELQKELQTVKANLDNLTKAVDEIKKALED